MIELALEIHIACLAVRSVDRLAKEGSNPAVVVLGAVAVVSARGTVVAAVSTLR